jgi:leucyl/phenylalanyl-tRNA---protein transferase
MTTMPQAGFPDPRTLRPGECTASPVAAGGDLSPACLLAAYRLGLFPWTEQPVTWWSPDPRGVLELDRLHVSRSLRRTLRRRTFTATVDKAFPEVVASCAAEHTTGGTWITPAFLAAYTELHRLGHAHSVECWREGRLVGGIYGVSVGGVFSGESMFHREDDASKAALWHLVQLLRGAGYAFLDVQMVTDATRRLGAEEIPRASFLVRLHREVDRSIAFPGTTFPTGSAPGENWADTGWAAP